MGVIGVGAPRPGSAGDLVRTGFGGLGSPQDLAGLGDPLTADAARAGVELPGLAGGAAAVEQTELGGLCGARPPGALGAGL